MTHTNRLGVVQRAKYFNQKEERSKYFDQREAEILSGFSRNQLRKLIEVELIVPIKRPAIFYTWKQLVFLRVLNYLRQERTFKEIERVFRATSNIPELIDSCDKMLFIAFGTVKSDGELGFAFSYLADYVDELAELKLRKSFLVDTEYVKFVFDYIINKESLEVKVKFGDIVAYNMPLLIKLLKETGKDSIEDFELKVG
ncbi:hypothetical protein [Nostoc commune]|uniref:hypothetical protein n=1 Tax=Nostoc commune TaxID=1178 RepID=UPI0018C6BFD5|nr:hypothetical protein [Nostoc commune]MBG1258416.1 hypothetical protein [Nostoc commune BAE]